MGFLYGWFWFGFVLVWSFVDAIAACHLHVRQIDGEPRVHAVHPIAYTFVSHLEGLKGIRVLPKRVCLWFPFGRFPGHTRLDVKLLNGSVFV